MKQESETTGLWARYKDWASETKLRTRMTIIGMWSVALIVMGGMMFGAFMFCLHLSRAVDAAI